MPAPIDKLIDIMAALRDPDTGCPWDVKQDFSTIAPYTIEEAYEVSDAIRREDVSDLREELGDLLLQVVFHAQMAKETGNFDFDDVVHTICDKMVERHPHVFGQERARSESELRDIWETRKERERRKKGAGGSAMDGVALALPALMRSQKLVKRAIRKGFEWPSTEDALRKCEEELEEFRDAAAESAGGDPVEEELGDLIFACVCLADQHGVDAEKALRRANDKFESRFRHMEAFLRERGLEMSDSTCSELADLWELAKTRSS